MRQDTPFGPVWIYPDMLPEKAAKHGARLELLWPNLDGFTAMHTGPSPGGAWFVRAPAAALEAAAMHPGSASEHPVAEGTVWPPIEMKDGEVVAKFVGRRGDLTWGKYAYPVTRTQKATLDGLRYMMSRLPRVYDDNSLPQNGFYSQNPRDGGVIIGLNHQSVTVHRNGRVTSNE